MVLAISFLTLAVEQVAVEIEQPFGNGNNGLPMQTYVRQIEVDLTGLLDAHDGLHTKSSAVARPPHEKQVYLQTNRTSNTFQSDVETDIQTDDGEQSSTSTPPHGHAHGHVNEEMREFVEA